jgi:hypothetical protein
MAKVPPFHATTVESAPRQRQVYHDHDDCPDAMKVRHDLREPGTGNKWRCITCIRLDQPETASGQPPGPERETLRRVRDLLGDLRLARGELALHQHRAPDPQRDAQFAALTQAIQALEAVAWPTP